MPTVIRRTPRPTGLGVKEARLLACQDEVLSDEAEKAEVHPPSSWKLERIKLFSQEPPPPPPPLPPPTEEERAPSSATIHFVGLWQGMQRFLRGHGLHRRSPVFSSVSLAGRRRTAANLPLLTPCMRTAFCSSIAGWLYWTSLQQCCSVELPACSEHSPKAWRMS